MRDDYYYDLTWSYVQPFVFGTLVQTLSYVLVAPPAYLSQSRAETPELLGRISASKLNPQPWRLTNRFYPAPDFTYV